MGGGDQPADRVDQRRHLGKGRQPLGDVAGARPSYVPIEGIVQVGGVTQAHQGARDVRSPDHASPRLDEDVVNLKRETDPLQLRDHLAAPLQSIGLPQAEKCLNLGIVERKEIPQDVHLAPGR